MTIFLTRSLAVLTLMSVLLNHASAGIINGDFSLPLSDPNAGWQNEFNFGDPPVIEGGQAKFAIDDGGVVINRQLEQTFLLPANAGFLSFEYRLFTDPTGGAPSTPADAFQASLFDPANFFDSLLAFNPTDPRFFGIDAVGNSYPPGQVILSENLNNGFTRISLDVSSLASQEVLLEFILIDEFDGVTTTVVLDNVVVTQAATVVPEPGAFAIWGVFGLATIGLTVRPRRQTERPTPLGGTCR